MDELIDQLAAKAGIDSAVAEKTFGLLLGFRRSQGPPDKVQALCDRMLDRMLDRIPGAEAAIAAASTGGGLSKLMSNGLIAVAARLLAPRLMTLGLGMGEIVGEIQRIAGELFKFSRDKIGADQMGEIIAGTPGLSQFA